MGLFDKVKGMLPADKGALKDKAQDVAAKLDDKAQELAEKDGKVGDIAEKAHQILDKVDGDDEAKDAPKK